METVKEIVEFIMNNTVVLVVTLLAVLTAIKQLLKAIESGLEKIDEWDTPPWLKAALKIVKKIIHILERISEFASANDGQTDS